MSCFDVEVKKIEHNSMGKISKTAIIDMQTLACINHLHGQLVKAQKNRTVRSYLDIVEVFFFHGFKVGDPGRYTP